MNAGLWGGKTVEAIQNKVRIDLDWGKLLGFDQLVSVRRSNGTLADVSLASLAKQGVKVGQKPANQKS